MNARSDEEYREIAQRAASVFLAIPGVHAVGIGGREQDGRATGEPVIKVFVREKRSSSHVSAGEMIPRSFQGLSTDVVQAPQLQSAALIPGALEDTPLDPQDPDDTRARPIIGGVRITAKQGPLGGTLGFLAEVIGEPNRVVGVTNHHVIYSGEEAHARAVGNPFPETSCSDCCSGVIGEVRAGESFFENQGVDAALITLSPGMRWSAEIKEVGPVRGSHDLTVAEVVGLTYQVKKRGRTTRLTGGIVHSIETSGIEKGGRQYSNAISVKPNPLPDAGDKVVIFVDDGDSGSALLNMNDEVVGLVFGKGIDNSDTPENEFGWGVATRISTVLQKFSASSGLNLQIATASVAEDVRTVPGASASPQVPPLVEQLRVDLEKTEEGQQLVNLWLRHASEMNSLVNGNRKVGAQWRLAGGRDVFRAMMDVANTGNPFPSEVDGRSFDDCVAGTIGVIQKFGSQKLREDLEKIESRILPCAGRSYTDVLRRLVASDHVSAAGESGA